MTQQQPNFEARFLHIEGRLAALELAREKQETRDIAILARVDGFIDDLRRIERVQMRGFDTIMQNQQTQATDIKSLQETQAQLVRVVERQEQNNAVLVEMAKDHKVAIESLAGQVRELTVGQRQIITILTGGKSQAQD